MRFRFLSTLKRLKTYADDNGGFRRKTVFKAKSFENASFWNFSASSGQVKSEASWWTIGKNISKNCKKCAFSNELKTRRVDRWKQNENDGVAENIWLRFLWDENGDF